MAARSKEWVYNYTPAGIVDSNQDGAWNYVSCECCVLSGRGLTDAPITCPEGSYPVWCPSAIAEPHSRLTSTVAP